MNHRRLAILFAASGLVLALAGCAGNDAGRVLDSIRAEDMAFHQKFLSAPEFLGRPTPSAEQDIASRYIALTAERIGLAPLLPGGSYFQEVPVEVLTVAPEASGLRLTTASAERTFAFPADATAGRWFETGRASGEIVFVGYGLAAPELGWDDLAGLDLGGRIAVVLEAILPDNHPLRPADNRRLLGGRAAALRGRGAAAVVTIIDEAREKSLADQGLAFDLPRRTRVLDIDNAAPGARAGGSAPAPFVQVEVRHGAGAAILGCPPEDLLRMSGELRGGKRVAPRLFPGRRLEIGVAVTKRRDRAFNVVGVLEGSDPVLKGEYLTVTSHHDHLAVREGRVFPGADDDISGVVGMIEIARALRLAPPKRSVIFVWNTAEELMLLGSYYFVQHCPVPVERISANLNLDMISRNAADHLYLVGSNSLSSELDASIRAMNEAPGPGFRLDDAYESPGHPDRFFFRSDQYPYIRYGIPGVWFFCGTTGDYHGAGDVEARTDYAKMVKVCRLVCRVALDIGGKPALLKLDRRPEVASRGPRNMAVAWQ
ncbi:MAG TPA: M28 family peptidase [Candidatus Aminicenantes bacterium]|nr:M28 family peptidase [Candidatus Aminicenantes bacterium]HRY65960.1 M28 family peptidase [Candidatus Aminicenantes bacterium]HRZ72991.1 M28 family peptidase [Candidatus Aminicenantes bacterium]